MKKKQHVFKIWGDGTIKYPKRLQCKLCGFEQTLLGSNIDIGCLEKEKLNGTQS